MSAAGGIGIALAACSSSTHLDPPGSTATGTGGESATTTTTTSTGTAGGGGGAPADLPCKSNPDCPFPTSVCDTIAHTCRECLVDADCTSKGGPVCSAGKCGCAKSGEQFCAAANGGGACVNKMTATTDCGDCGHACFGACAAGKCADPWEPTSLVGAPAARSRHVAVWDETDKLMIVWGGQTPTGSTATGGIYNPATNTWTATSAANAPSARVDATAVWDDTEKAMIVWGGRTKVGGEPLGTGALYDPVKNVWKTMSSNGNPPSPRWSHTAIWTGAKMIVWGGTTTGTAPLGDGASYTPATDSWAAVAPGAAPAPRYDHTAVWTGDSISTMLIWGGYGIDPVAMTNLFLADGSTLDTKSSTWAPLNSTGNPTPRSQATAVWIPDSMIIWGGTDTMGYLGDGAKYSGGSWYPLNNPSPTPRALHSAVRIKAKVGDEMMIWGGLGAAGYLNTGALLDPTSLNWTLSVPTAPVGRARHTTVVNGTGGSKMIIWGGDTAGGLTDSGAIFDASTM